MAEHGAELWGSVHPVRESCSHALLEKSMTRPRGAGEFKTLTDQAQGRIIELHFFGGLTFDEIAAEHGVSLRTVKSDWAMARVWLYQQLKK